MSSSIELVLFDIGGVLGSNGWDREQRTATIERFGLDAEDFQYRHEETVGALEVGAMSLDEYLRITANCGDMTASCADLKAFIFEQSVPWPDSIAVARDLATKVAEYVGCAPGDTARATTVLESLASDVAPEGASGDITFEFHQSGEELRIEARSGARSSKATLPLQA